MKDTKNNLFIPAAIIIAGALIAAGIYFSGGVGGSGTQAQGPTGPSAAELARNVKPVSADDHSVGNPATASVIVIEYSDLECPFCKTFHATMRQLMDTYQSGGKVAWVYRHFPLNIHPKAANEALAAECVASLGGNDAFWKFIDRVFEVTPSNNQLDPAELPKLAKDAGVDATKFDTCMSSATYKQKIDASIQDAMKAGGDGTPFSIIISKQGDIIPLAGAYPFEDVKQIIDSLLAKN